MIDQNQLILCYLSPQIDRMKPYILQAYGQVTNRGQSVPVIHHNSQYILTPDT
jgi:hypothetical protein